MTIWRLGARNSGGELSDFSHVFSTAREYEPEAGLYYYRARFYDPLTGRFLQRDPVGPDGLGSLYAYVSNSPAVYVDPSGHEDWRHSGEMIFETDYITDPHQPEGGNIIAWAPRTIYYNPLTKQKRVERRYAHRPPYRHVAFVALIDEEEAGGSYLLNHWIDDGFDQVAPFLKWTGRGLTVATAFTPAGLLGRLVIAYLLTDVVSEIAGEIDPNWDFMHHVFALGFGKNAEIARALTSLGVGLASAFESIVRGSRTSVPKSSPKPSPKFKDPTNFPRFPPADIPPGWRVREMPPTEQYPHGYWTLEKPIGGGNWQKIDPSTMKPGTRPETHVPLPPGGK